MSTDEKVRLSVDLGKNSVTACLARGKKSYNSDRTQTVDTFPSLPQHYHAPVWILV